MKIGKSFQGFMVVAITSAAFLVASAASAETKVHKRKENQQDRIAQGVKSGQLTAHETAKLENKEAKLNKETREMREDNGGKLTAKDKRIVNRQQNKLSRQIYRQKFDAQTQPGAKPADPSKQ